jgi:hypothetical protein
VKSVASLFLLFATAAFAQGTTDYKLNGGQIHFHVPPQWTAIMQKADGNPQAIAFQVPDPTAQASGEAADVTVKTRQLNNAAEFTGVIQDELARAKAQAGYADDPANKDASIHQYFVTRAKTRYQVRDNLFMIGSIAVHVRCQRPLLQATPEAWNAQFDSACDGVVASLKE